MSLAVQKLPSMALLTYRPVICMRYAWNRSTYPGYHSGDHLASWTRSRSSCIMAASKGVADVVGAIDNIGKDGSVYGHYSLCGQSLAGGMKNVIRKYHTPGLLQELTKLTSNNAPSDMRSSTYWFKYPERCKLTTEPLAIDRDCFCTDHNQSIWKKSVILQGMRFCQQSLSSRNSANSTVIHRHKICNFLGHSTNALVLTTRLACTHNGSRFGSIRWYSSCSNNIMSQMCDRATGQQANHWRSLTHTLLKQVENNIKLCSFHKHYYHEQTRLTLYRKNDIGDKVAQSYSTVSKRRWKCCGTGRLKFMRLSSVSAQRCCCCCCCCCFCDCRENRIQHCRTYCSSTTTTTTTTNGSGVSSEGVRTEPPWRILFFGTDRIAVETLKALQENMTTSGSLVESLDVVTGKKQLPVRMFSEANGLSIQQWPIQTEHNKYDVGILVSFGHLIPDRVINMFPYGILNMHPSLLPRWRGASPIIHTVLHGDSVTGVSVMDIRPRHFDIGPVLLQQPYPVPARVTSFQLADQLGKLGASTVLECLKDLPTLERLEHDQEQEGVTYAHKIFHKNANVDWERHTAIEVDRQYRAISELHPLRSEWHGRSVKLLDIVDPALLTDLSPSLVRGYQGNITQATPGTVGFCKKKRCLIIKCKEGLIGFERVVIMRTLSAQDFYNGYMVPSADGICFTSLDNDINKYIGVERPPAHSLG